MNIKKYILLVLSILGIFVAAVGGVIAANVVLNKQETQHIDVPAALDKQTSNKKINILILGTDSGGTRSDVIILASIDPKNNALNMLSIPRDTRVKIGKSYQKINAALSIGKEDLTIKTVKEITGMPIHYYMTVNFEGFRNIVDILGGVDFNVPVKMDYDDPFQNLHIHLNKGMQHLNGDKAEQFVRFRHYPQGDLDRISAQQAFMKALFDQKLKISYISKADDIFNEMKKDIKTNFGPADMTKNLGAITALKSENIKMYQLPGEAKYIDDLSYYVYDPKATTDLIKQDLGY